MHSVRVSPGYQLVSDVPVTYKMIKGVFGTNIRTSQRLFDLFSLVWPIGIMMFWWALFNYAGVNLPVTDGTLTLIGIASGLVTLAAFEWSSNLKGKFTERIRSYERTTGDVLKVYAAIDVECRKLVREGDISGEDGREFVANTRDLLLSLCIAVTDLHTSSITPMSNPRYNKLGHLPLNIGFKGELRRLCPEDTELYYTLGLVEVIINYVSGHIKDMGSAKLAAASLLKNINLFQTQCILAGFTKVFKLFSYSFFVYLSALPIIFFSVYGWITFIIFPTLMYVISASGTTAKWATDPFEAKLESTRFIWEEQVRKQYNHIKRIYDDTLSQING